MGLKEVSSDYTVSLHYDRRLYRQDIEGSIAHARMLAKQEIIEQADASAIVDGLSRIREDIESNDFPWRPEHEDIHMNIELRLHELIGEPALKLHPARSRNDQVALDMRMYMKEIISETLNALHGLRRSLVQLADDNTEVVMPGYTHLQRAQPVLFAHHMLAYFEMFGRDQLRFQQAYERADVMPLGSGALAGLPILWTENLCVGSWVSLKFLTTAWTRCQTAILYSILCQPPRFAPCTSRDLPRN